MYKVGNGFDFTTGGYLFENTHTYPCEITNRKEYQDAEDNFLKYLRQYKHADDDKIARAMRGEVMVRMGILKEI